MGHESSGPDAVASARLREALNLRGEDSPFQWQLRLLGRFLDGNLPEAVDVPTGLGKTGVMAVWLVARSLQAPLPRRLVYVVDRRAVVDQATEAAIELREWVRSNASVKASLGLGERELPISTLRGQFADNREWLEDPAAPAIIVGTVDMIGSRLLFQGYRTSRKMRPFHAALLSNDALIVLDEAHLVPSFEGLLQDVARLSDVLAKAAPQGGPAPVRVLTLTATARTAVGDRVSIEEADLEGHAVLRQRLGAPKWLELKEAKADQPLAARLATEAWALVAQGQDPVRCIVFCDKRKDAEECRKEVEKLDKKAFPGNLCSTELFVGGRRVRERQDASARLRELGFLARKDSRRERPAFLFATSAAEVGVDLDADRMVCDLVPFERMVQRLGRVNRRGAVPGGARVVVVERVESGRVLRKARRGADNGDETGEGARLDATKAALALLSRSEEGLDASPGAFRKLGQRAREDPDLAKLLTSATTPEPLRPALTLPLLEAWALTSLEDHPGRPDDIRPWLRGWVKKDPPQTTILWRKWLPLKHGADGRRVEMPQTDVEEFFEAAPPHVSELVERESYQVQEWLEGRAERIQDGYPQAARIGLDGIVGFSLNTANADPRPLRLRTLLDAGPGERETLENLLNGRTLVLDATFGGLRGDGLLDAGENDPPRTADDGLPEPWLTTVEGSPPAVPFLVQLQAGTSTDPPKGWRTSFRVPSFEADDGAAEWLVVWKHQRMETNENGRAIHPLQLLDDHHAASDTRAREIGRRLGMEQADVEAAATAAGLHDGGKAARRWQLAFRAPAGGKPFAKTPGPISFRILDGYRHEVGSVLLAEAHPALQAMDQDRRELALHLIAAHHGYARPVLDPRNCEHAPPSAFGDIERRIAVRFARNQARWGPWALAWWETLVRAADHQASRDNETSEPVKTLAPVEAKG